MAGTASLSVRNLEFTRDLNSPLEKVYEAWTNPAGLARWFSLSDEITMPIAEIDLRVGAKYRIGMKSPDGALEIVGGVFKRVVYPELLAFTWSVGGGGTLQKKSQVIVELSEKGTGTEMVLKHQFIPGEQLRLQYEKEWQIRLARLEKLLEEPSAAVVRV